MTGYATVSSGAPSVSESTLGSGAAPATRGGAVHVELRSVNGRFLDLSFRLPDDMRSLEPALRDMLGQGLRRGKVEMRISTDRGGETAWPQPQPDQLNQLSRLEGSVQAWMPKAAGLSVHEVLQWCRNAAPVESAEGVALATARSCVEALAEARAREGARLVEQLQQRITGLRRLAADAGPLLPQVVARQQERFLERWREALDSAKAADGGSASTASVEQAHERALTEAASFAIRIDVAEELSRLVAHLDEMDRLLQQGGELGKRLDFLIQELHREANTLGSKSAALELTRISVDMKVLIEQLREQVQNIE
jgi:uncharacterized protein (TIGR00255 family)